MLKQQARAQLAPLARAGSATMAPSTHWSILLSTRILKW